MEITGNSKSAQLENSKSHDREYSVADQWQLHLSKIKIVAKEGLSKATADLESLKEREKQLLLDIASVCTCAYDDGYGECTCLQDPYHIHTRSCPAKSGSKLDELHKVRYGTDAIRYVEERIPYYRAIIDEDMDTAYMYERHRGLIASFNPR